MQEVLSFDRNSVTVDSIKKSILKRLYLGVVQEPDIASKREMFKALASMVMEWLSKGWLQTQRKYYEDNSKRVYYISMEFLLGKSLKSNLLNLGLLELVEKAVHELGYTLDELAEMEDDAGLGNGGLGRLAACFVDSMATLSIPAYGYGIRYDYGIFSQKIVDGFQVETPDNWLRYGNAWEICRVEYLYPVKFYGRIHKYIDASGKEIFDWVDTQEVLAMAYDIPVPGYGNTTVNSLRLWQAQSPKGFDFNYFNHGNYMQAIEDIAMTQNISRVLYPNDSIFEGQELRLKQEYFLVSATIQDIIRRYNKTHLDLRLLFEHVAIQLNDTHPTLGIAEMMRILVDREEMEWHEAWKVTSKIFNYTNHTILPEALERWPVHLFEKLLPRHLDIIYKINSQWLGYVESVFPDDLEKVKKLSIIEETPNKMINMANLAIVGSEHVNGVSNLHSELLKKHLFKEFFEIFPNKFTNMTNGITLRRWVKLCNPLLANLFDRSIGDSWITDYRKFSEIHTFLDDASFIEEWQKIKTLNKERLSDMIFDETKISVNCDSLFDSHVKRIHEYKRQLMNIIRVIHDYILIKENPNDNHVPKTVIFSGKAAPGYVFAKLIIKLINSVATVINGDKFVREFLKVVFLPNYRVSSAEIIIPASDLSEQISLAGTEASGTGNMKFALNGALTIGTLDGANVEMAEHIGIDDMFIFGLTEGEVLELRPHYSSQVVYERNPSLKKALDLIKGGFFDEDKNLFEPISNRLLEGGDYYMVLEDFSSYTQAHRKVDDLFMKKEEWTKTSIRNVSGMGFFSSDRVIADYAKNIWNVHSIS
ncbi:MAG: glycogen/starch/alpha-glucan phosphorylase [Victivallaceae bacterium]